MLRLESAGAVTDRCINRSCCEHTRPRAKLDIASRTCLQKCVELVSDSLPTILGGVPRQRIRQAAWTNWSHSCHRNVEVVVLDGALLSEAWNTFWMVFPLPSFSPVRSVLCKSYMESPCTTCAFVVNVGEADGILVGELVGVTVGEALGAVDGLVVGELGITVGEELGGVEGMIVGGAGAAVYTKKYEKEIDINIICMHIWHMSVTAPYQQHMDKNGCHHLCHKSAVSLNQSNTLLGNTVDLMSR
jgi:hypothetical protein